MTFRATARVLLFDPADRVLLFLQYGKDHGLPPRWMSPGGGVDAGETFSDAARRETQEETGLDLGGLPRAFREEDFEPDQRWHPYTTGRWAWFAVRTHHFEPTRDGWTDEERMDVVDVRWFSADELEADPFEHEPAELPDLIRRNVP
jgi:8-oxo-dGTP pyrophosphatase MutT (NUDIX family)